MLFRVIKSRTMRFGLSAPGRKPRAVVPNSAKICQVPLLAFQCIDLLAAVGTVVLLLLTVVPVLANIAPRAERIACMSNLRLISRGFYQWSTEHGGQLPWWLHQVQGGTRGHLNYHDLWFQYSSLSNLLDSPRLIADPGDERRNVRVASFWDNRPNGGLANPGYRNNSVSYFLGIHAVDIYPKSIVAGDRNMSTDGPGGCVSQINTLWNITVQGVGWTNSVHGRLGNIAFMDGSVGETDTSLLKKAIEWRPREDVDLPIWNTHFMFP
jgi:prepilin-type processing-associated H-X9-DG protein